MTDATNEYFVDAAALERDAATFAAWGDQLESMAEALPVDVSTDAFSALPGAVDVRTRFIDAAMGLQNYLHDGAAEFSGLAEKLDTTLRLYTEAEDASAGDVARVSRELDSL